MSRIAIVSEHASPLGVVGGVDAGGQNIYVAHVARQLARLGHRVDVFTRRDSAQLPESVAWLPGVRVIHVRAGPAENVPKEYLLPFMPSFLADMQRCARSQGAQYEVVHANFFMSGWVGLRFAHASGSALVTTFHALGRVRRLHQGADDGFADTRFDIESELMARSDRIVAECPQDLRDMIEHYGVDRARVQIVPCGFDADELEPLDRHLSRARLQWPHDEFTVLQLGRMVPRKGVDTVIRAIAVMKHSMGRRARLVIAGGPSCDPAANHTREIDRLMRLAHDEDVTSEVHFMGRCDRETLSLVYSAADVFVTTPWYEPFGITPVEAMACGRPVVGAAVGGIQSTVRDGRTGLLVPPKDPVALAGCLARLQDDRVLAEQLGRAGLQRARRFYTWERVARQLVDVYRNARECARSRARARARTGTGPHAGLHGGAYAGAHAGAHAGARAGTPAGTHAGTRANARAVSARASNAGIDHARAGWE